MKKSLRNLLLSLSVGAMINSVSCTPKNNEPIAQVENHKEVYAVLANGSGPEQANRYSQSNFVYSALNVLSTYKLLREQGMDDEHITLLIYNPANINLFETREYKSLLENKAFAEVLPTEQDIIQIDGKATRSNFLNAIRNLPSDANDSIYIAFSTAAPKEQEETEIMYGNRNPYIQFDKETVFSMELGVVIKGLEYEKMTIIQNSGESVNLIPSLDRISSNLSHSEGGLNPLEKVLGIVSPNTKDIENEIFTIRFISEYIKNKNKSIQEIINQLTTNPSFPPKAYYFDVGGRAPEECPWFYLPFLEN